eukprot:1151515-Pelagomonas_calceolata.AAC.3
MARCGLESYLCISRTNMGVCKYQFCLDWGTGGGFGGGWVRNGKFLTVRVNNDSVVIGISVSDDSTESTGSKRKLLSSMGGVDGKASFLNGQTMYNLNSAPLTKDQQDLFNYVLNGASVTSPYMLLLASLAFIATLFSL